MIVVVASTKPAKVDAVRAAVERIAGIDSRFHTVTIECREVGAVAPAMPMSDGETLEGVSVTDPHGHRIPVQLRSNGIWPKGKLPAGERVTVHATVKRAGYLGWLLGGTKELSASFVTPRAAVRATLLHLQDGAPVVLHFRGGATHLALKLPGYADQELVFDNPRTRFDTGVRATGANRFGTLVVAEIGRASCRERVFRVV